MRKLLWFLALAIGSRAPFPTPTAATSIGVYFDANATVCDLSLAPWTQFTVYIVAVLTDDGLANGTSGAEFRVDGWDPTWFAAVTANPQSNLTLGNPLQGGCQIAFPQCQTGGMARRVLLYTIGGLSGMTVPPTRLEVRGHGNPSSPFFTCPNMVNCSAPVFSRFCVEGRAGCINQPQTCCILPVSPVTWTGVRALYGGAP